MPLLADYLIEQQGKDWADLLSGWVPPLPESFTVCMVNRFGDVFAVYDDGSVHMLDIGMGVVERLADGRDQFCDLIDLNDNAKDWLMIPLTDACRDAGLVLSENQCYGFKVLPILGGEYTVENVVACDLSIQYSFTADIFRQTKDLPDGTKVEIALRNLQSGKKPAPSL
jgi:hypothetical protein